LKDAVEILSLKSPYSSGLCMDTSQLRIKLSRGGEEIAKDKNGPGIVLRTLDGTSFRESAFPLEEDGTVLEKAKELAADVSERGEFNDGGSTSGEASHSLVGEEDLGEVPLNEKLELGRTLRNMTLKKEPKLVDALLMYVERREKRLFTDGEKILFQDICRVVLRIILIGACKGKIDWWAVGTAFTGGFEKVGLEETEIERAVERLHQLLRGSPPEPGYYDAIVDAEMAGVIAHEAFGHGVESDMIVRKRAMADQYFGKEVGSPLVHITDDPTYPEAYGSYVFDDEGNQAERTRIIEGGVLNNPLTDCYSSMALGRKPTGNGRRERWQHKAYSRMSNTFFERGDTPPSKMIEDLDRGVYVLQGTNGMEDPKGWGLQCQAKMALEVRGGRFTGRVFAPVGLTGFVPDVLKSVSQVGSDFLLNFGGTCIKGFKEHVPVSVGGPHLRLKIRMSG
jgi:TldD protein